MNAIFNLVYHPWIPVHTDDGTAQEMSLLEVFQRKDEIRYVACSSPLETRAIERLLIALTYHARSRDESVTDYLEAESGLFDIDRFCQYNIEAYRPQLFGTDRLLFPETIREWFPEVLSPAEAARAMLAKILFDRAGIRTGVADDALSRGPRSAPIGPAWLGRVQTVIVHLDTLAETIEWNLPDPDPRGIEDIPMWEDDPDRPRSIWSADQIGVCQLLVWPGRRMRLQFNDDGAVTGALLTNGDVLAKRANLEDVEPHGLWHYAASTKRISYRNCNLMNYSWDAFRELGGPLPVGVRRLIENPRRATIVTLTTNGDTVMRDVVEDRMSFDLDHVPLAEIKKIDNAILVTRNNPGQLCETLHHSVAPYVRRWIGGQPLDLGGLASTISQAMSEAERLVYTTHFNDDDFDRQHSIYTSTRTKWLTLLRELKDLAGARLH